LAVLDRNGGESLSGQGWKKEGIRGEGLTESGQHNQYSWNLGEMYRRMNLESYYSSSYKLWSLENEGQ